VSDGADGLRAAGNSLADEAAGAVAAGAGLVIIDNGGLGPTRAPIPSLLAAGAVHHRLVDARLRTRASIVVVADDARDVHAITMLLAAGVDAICPRLALHTVAADADASDDDLESAEAQTRYQEAVEAGVLKILSKMGISTVDSYRGAHLFEAIGLGREVVDMCFGDVPSPLAGVGWDALGVDALEHHAHAFPAPHTDGASSATPARGDRAAHPGDGAEPRQAMLRRGATRSRGNARTRGRDGSSIDLETPGYYRVRKGGEYHVHGKDEVQALNDLTLVQEEPPDGQTREMMAAQLLQRAIRDGSTDRYEHFAAMIDERPLTEPHDLLDALAAGPSVPLDEVEPAHEITRRFSTGAMSHGSLSREAPENLARAMTLVGGMSNCGEGGEDPQRYRTRGLGRDDRNSRIKQIASGRFGVTPEYVAFADELNIKIAQGSKPGEGGQLPGHKVSEEIAQLRHTQPGVGLISPPPHHDIYSIEDLAQLIYDLKQVNAAQVSVKLVAEQGVGMVAAGCIKGLADVVQISGANGGTGASPLSSIKHAGLPWEVGLAEAQQVLVENGLRSRCRLRVDGGFLTGRQVMMAALLGADEYSFGTGAMIAEGCTLLRACHRDTCKPGVATQRPHLRANFTGTPEGVAAYFWFVAEDVRRRLAALGFCSLDDAIGRVDLLRQRRTGDARADALDLSPLLRVPEPLVPFREHDNGSAGPPRFVTRVELQDPRGTLGDQLLADAYRPLWDGDDIDLSYRITNADRAVGAALSGALALEFGAAGPRGRAWIALTGAAGQSFGAFLSAGVHLDLTGEANDYVGKGMGGGRIVIRPPEIDPTSVPVLAGNTCLYGATAGELFVAGAVGERFAVRNSGAVAVVEGAGDHCCEYLTGGVVVVLGAIGSNLGAGMTGGEAFVWAPDEWAFFGQVNTDLVEAARPGYDALDECRWLIERHAELTGSVRATALLDGWSATADHLWLVLPRQRAGQVTPVERRRVATA
jgi:glutamate synthase (ferredoxin)